MRSKANLVPTLLAPGPPPPDLVPTPLRFDLVPTPLRRLRGASHPLDPFPASALPRPPQLRCKANLVPTPLRCKADLVPTLLAPTPPR